MERESKSQKDTLGNQHLRKSVKLNRHNSICDRYAISDQMKWLFFILPSTENVSKL